MRLLLDTNVVSELIKPNPDRQVAAWILGNDEANMCLSVATIAEIRRGAASLDKGRRRDDIERWIGNDLVPRFSDRIVPIDMAVAEAWGDLIARSRRAGFGISTMDGFIAATAVVHALTLATRNVRHFTWCGLSLLDPWTST